MGDLGASFVIGLPQRRQRGRIRVGDRQRQVLLAQLPENMLGEETPEPRAGADAPAIVAAESHDIGSEAMEARQCVSSHAHHSVPLRFERDLADLRKRLLERALRPGAVDLETSEAQRADAAEEKPSGLIVPE